MDQLLVKKLISGAILITPTRRLASHVQANLAAIVRHRYPVWETPSIYSIEDWYKTLWDSFEMNGDIQEQLLSPTQSLLAFENIIINSSMGAAVLDPYQTAKVAFEAWKILNQWLALDLLEKEYTQIDYLTFTEWVNQYLAFLNNNQYIDYAMLPQIILNNLMQKDPTSLILYGFEEKTPFISHLATILQEQGWDITWQDPMMLNPERCERHAFLDEEKEHLAAISFAKQQLENGKKNIAIVVPQLADYRQKLERLLRDAFDPLEVAEPVIKVNSHFNISAAIPLINYPLVSIALACLRLGTNNFNQKDYQRVLDSSRANCNYQHLIELKRWHRGKLTLTDVLSYLNKAPECENDWQQRLLALEQNIKTLPEKATYHYWASKFRHILQQLNWPANQALSSIEYQSMIRFENLLQELSDCDGVLEETSYNTALYTLQKLASYIPFQPENKGAKVQVLGVLEAAGQQFDSLWVMGMQSETWPGPAAHNPFIDLDEQRRRDMPHASADREMNYALKMTERFKHSANIVIFSHAIQNKERKWEISELIREIPLVKEPSNESIKQMTAESYFEKSGSKLELETIVDNQAPALGPTELSRTPSRLLELQSACPFKAFAEFRLNATQREEKSIWLEASDQGNILHQILEKWWKCYPTQDRFIKMSTAEREGILKTLIEQALKKYFTAKSPAVYYEVEINRLLIILRDYFELEASRPSFTVVEAEYKQIYSLGGLTFNIRCDRIDADINGNKIIVDYKTGKFSIFDWEGERLASPQMPLYALAYNEPALSAVMITNLRSDECRYIGYASTDLGVRGLKIKSDFEGIKQTWHIHLEALAKAFANGDARVDPRNSTITCQFCHLHALCRIEEREVLQ